MRCGLLGLLDSLHFPQLCSQSLRYFSSLVRTASAALLHNALGSSHPASRHNLAIKAQESWTSSMSNVTRLARTSRHNSLANTHVLRCLKRLRACSRIFWRLNSKVISLTVSYSRFSFIYSLLVSFLKLQASSSGILLL